MNKNPDYQLLIDKVNKLEIKQAELTNKHTIIIELIADSKERIDTLTNVLLRLNEQMLADELEKEKPAEAAPASG